MDPNQPNPDEKASMMQPPPYQDFSQYPNAGQPGYGPPPVGFQGPPQGFQGPPPQGYQAPPQGFQGPPPQGYPAQPGFQGPGYGQYPQGQYGPPVTAAPMQQTTVVVNQGTLLSPMVNDYLGYSIFTCLCCFWPVGLAALIFSCCTRDANTDGRIEDAKNNSKMARNLNHAALGLGIACIIIIIIMRTMT